MSAHISRKDRWTEINPNKHVNTNGYVQKNPRGKWDAVLSYLTRSPINPREKAGTPRPWYTRRETVGEFKRAREGMMAIEERIKKVKDKKDPDIII